MIFVDTGAWFASFVRSDADHGRAIAWLRANREPLLTTDYVIDETLTLLKARGELAAAFKAAEDFIAGTLAHVESVNANDFAAAVVVFGQCTDKGWSFTDCTSKVVMERLGIRIAFAFDHHFRQFGTTSVVP